MDDVTISQGKVILWFVVSLASYIGPFVFIYFIYQVLSLPMRRRESAVLFLDLLELGLEDGLSLEQAILQAAQQNDTSLGKRFRSSATHLQAQMPLDEMFKNIRRLLPPSVIAMIAIGAELGDVRRVLPACRQALHDALSQTRGALNYLGILGFVVLPIVPLIIFILSTFVLPKFEAIAEDFGGGVSPFSKAVFVLSPGFLWAQIAVLVFFQIIFISYGGGSGSKKRARWSIQIGDRLQWCLPWRRKRMQRDFATMLALLVDTGVPEERAVLLAAEVAHNILFMKRAQLAAEQLRAGTKLIDAVRTLDDSGEFHWRLTNAIHGRDGFLAALRGWFEALDAKAFQQEQAAAQTLTTALVLWNGFVVGAFVIGMFNVLTNIIEEGVLW